MANLELIKIFLASPRDVPSERRYVEEVVNEINDSFAIANGFFLKLVSSKDLIPEYGRDGQAIVNDQVANMEECELFVGIMWYLVGTRTPRAQSGTIEEFRRAKSAREKYKKPDIWFYFRSAKKKLTTDSARSQRRKVMDFKRSLKSKSIYREYDAPKDFCDKFRSHLTKWLNKRIKSKSVSSSIATQKKTRRSSSKKNRSIISPGSLIKLDDNFYRASVSTLPDNTVQLNISTAKRVEINQLNSLKSTRNFTRKAVAFADRYTVGIFNVSAISSKSTGSTTQFTVKLSPLNQLHNRSFQRFTFNNYSPEKIAEYQTRFLLLGDPLPSELNSFANIQYPEPGGNYKNLSQTIFPELWAKQNPKRHDFFLPRAWLTAIYYLKVTNIIDDVLKLQLGPISNNRLSVQFEGSRQDPYSSGVHITITAKGTCQLKV